MNCYTFVTFGQDQGFKQSVDSFDSYNSRVIIRIIDKIVWTENDFLIWIAYEFKSMPYSQKEQE